MNIDTAPVVAQWRSNRRLRLACGVAVLFVVFNVASSLSASRSETAATYRDAHRLWQRLDGAARDAVWIERAAESSKAIEQVVSTMATASGDGQAQAEAQAILQGLAAAAGLPAAIVRSEGAVLQREPIAIWEVAARLDAQGGMAEINALLSAIAAQQWVQVERVDVGDGEPGRLQLTMRAYFHHVDVGDGGAP